MHVDFTPDQHVLLRRAIEAGRFHSADEAVKEALCLWEQRERGRAEFLATLDEASAQIARGEGIPITQASMRELADDVKRRGRERLAAGRHTRV